MAVFFLFFAVEFGVRGLLEEREEGTLSRLLVAPVTAGVGDRRQSPRELHAGSDEHCAARARLNVAPPCEMGGTRSALHCSSWVGSSQPSGSRHLWRRSREPRRRPARTSRSSRWWAGSSGARSSRSRRQALLGTIRFLSPQGWLMQGFTDLRRTARSVAGIAAPLAGVFVIAIRVRSDRVDEGVAHGGGMNVRKVFAIAEVNLRRLLRDKTGAFFIFVFPFLIILALGAAFGSGSTPTLGLLVPANAGPPRTGSPGPVRRPGTSRSDRSRMPVRSGPPSSGARSRAGSVTPAASTTRVRAGETVPLTYQARPGGAGTEATDRGERGRRRAEHRRCGRRGSPSPKGRRPGSTRH